MIVWEKIEIGNAGLKIADGNYSAKYPSSNEFVEKGIPFIRANNFRNKTVIDDQLYYITPEKHNELKKGHLLPDDVLITTRGNIGEVAIVPDRHYDSNINAQIVLLRCDHKWLPKFLLYALCSDSVKEQIPTLTTGTALKQLPVGNLKKIVLPLPPLNTQKKIAAILDAADLYQHKTKTIIEKYDQLAQSLFLDMFGDPVNNLKGFELCTIRDLIIDAKYGTSSASEEEGKYPYLRMNNITFKGYMDYTNLKYIGVAEKDKDKYLVKKGDILFNRTNSKELVGKTGIIELEDEMIIAGYLIRVRVNNLANPYYLWAHLNSKWAKTTLNNMCKSIVGMANINAQELQGIKILKAPINLQNQFAERIQMIILQKMQAQASLQKAEDLFNSLLQKAFKGELVKE